MPNVLEADETPEQNRKSWPKTYSENLPYGPPKAAAKLHFTGERGRSAYLPKCFGKMKIITMIEDEEVIKKTLKHLGLWEIKERLPPKASLRQH